MIVIDRSSRILLASMYLGGLAVAALFIFVVKIPFLTAVVSAFVLWFLFWQTYFFRIPKRKLAENCISSICDGRVVIVEKAVEREYLKKECIQVSVYMNFFDTHANFWPADGTLLHYEYHPGKHFFASNPKASLDNEHTCALLKTTGGKEILFKQIAGGFARRISFYHKDGDTAKAGEQFGIIKFGSRIDYFFPPDTKVLVKVGDIVRACETPMAEL